MSDGADGSGPDYNVCPAFQNRLQKKGNIVCIILIISICIYYHIRSQLKTCVKSHHKAAGKPLILIEADDVIDPVGLCNFHGIVCAAVIYYEPFHCIEAVDLSREISQGNRKCFSFIIAGDLNNKFHVFRK